MVDLELAPTQDKILRLFFILNNNIKEVEMKNSEQGRNEAFF